MRNPSVSNQDRTHDRRDSSSVPQLFHRVLILGLRIILLSANSLYWISSFFFPSHGRYFRCSRSADPCIDNKCKKPQKTPQQNNMAELNAEFTELSRGIYFCNVRNPILFSYNYSKNKACKITKSNIKFF